MHEHTRLRLPGARGEVWTEDEVGPAPSSAAAGRRSSTTRGRGVRCASLRRGRARSRPCARRREGEYVVDAQERRHPGRVRRAGRRQAVAGRGARGRGRVGGLPPAAHGVELVGGRRRRPTDGRSVGWNLVSGINDPPRAQRARDLGRRRAVRARACEFDGLDAIDFDDGARLEFECRVRARPTENLLLVRYSTASRSAASPGRSRRPRARARPRGDGAPRRALVMRRAPRRRPRSRPLASSPAPWRLLVGGEVVVVAARQRLERRRAWGRRVVEQRCPRRRVDVRRARVATLSLPAQPGAVEPVRHGHGAAAGSAVLDRRERGHAPVRRGQPRRVARRRAALAPAVAEVDRQQREPRGPIRASGSGASARTRPPSGRP